MKKQSTKKPAKQLVQQPVFCRDASHRTAAEKKELVRRLTIIAGQVNTIIKMINEDKPCDDVLLNCMSTSNALKSAGNLVIKGHLESLFDKKIDIDDKEVEYLNSLFYRINNK